MIESESSSLDTGAIFKTNLFMENASNGVGNQLSAAQYFVMYLFEE